MKKSRIEINGLSAVGKLSNSHPGFEPLRKWIPCEEFCELYRLPKTSPARKEAPKYSTSKATAARKCCERLAAKGLITIRRIDGRLYVSQESVLSFGETA